MLLRALQVNFRRIRLNGCFARLRRCGGSRCSVWKRVNVAGICRTAKQDSTSGKTSPSGGYDSWSCFLLATCLLAGSFVSSQPRCRAQAACKLKSCYVDCEISNAHILTAELACKPLQQALFAHHACCTAKLCDALVHITAV